MANPSFERPLNRRVFAGALLAAPWALSLAGPAVAAAAVGQAAPDFSATDTSGQNRKLSDYKGKLVVLEWINPGCPFVQKHYNGNMQSLQKEFAGRGVAWLAINSTETGHGDYLTPARLAGWLGEKQAAPTATLMDESGKIGQLYGART
ncbi:MAG: redoxin domain-containing protein, partial [Polaromonas sp.]|nr:redoxin domain-containing protein [Polaromonas sp.]